MDMIGRMGLEPMISCVSDRCSNHLNYLPLFIIIQNSQPIYCHTHYIDLTTKYNNSTKVDSIGVEPIPPGLQPGASTELAYCPN